MAQTTHETLQSPDLGFAISGGMGLDAVTEADLIVAAFDAGLGPAFITEVSGAAATCVAAAVAVCRPNPVLGTGILPLASLIHGHSGKQPPSQRSPVPPFCSAWGSRRARLWGLAWLRASCDAASHEAVIADQRAILDGQRRGPFALGGATGTRVRILLGTLGPKMTEVAS